MVSTRSVAMFSRIGLGKYDSMVANADFASDCE
jgi:hypothetical protein